MYASDLSVFTPLAIFGTSPDLPHMVWGDDVDSRFVLEAGGGANCRIKQILIFGENLYSEEINMVIDDRKVRGKSNP